MQLCIIFNDQFYTAPVWNTNTDAGIFHGTGKSDCFSCSDCSIVFFFYSVQCFNKTGRIVNNLSIWKDTAWTDGIAVTDFPWGNTDFISHHIKKGFCCKTGLSYAETAESASRRVICIISSSFNFEVFISIRSGCMGAGTL